MRTNIQTPSNDSIHKGSLDTCQLKTCIYMYDSGEEILSCDLNLSTPSLCIHIMSYLSSTTRRTRFSKNVSELRIPTRCEHANVPSSCPPTSSATRFGMLPRCQRIFSTDLDILPHWDPILTERQILIGPFNARYWMVCIGSQRLASFWPRLSARLHKGVL